jgi:hypothetical protein
MAIATDISGIRTNRACCLFQFIERLGQVHSLNAYEYSLKKHALPQHMLNTENDPMNAGYFGGYCGPMDI